MHNKDLDIYVLLSLKKLTVDIKTKKEEATEMCWR